VPKKTPVSNIDKAFIFRCLFNSISDTIISTSFGDAILTGRMRCDVYESS